MIVPPKYPCATIFVDESSNRASSGSFFVVGAIKLRNPGKLMREVEDIRDKYGFAEEFKFSGITRGKITTFYKVIDALEASDAHIAACVVDRSKNSNPFKCGDPEWEVHARVAAKLLVGVLNPRELASAILDKRTTPVGTAFDDTVRRMVNQRLKATGLVSAVCADSKSTDGLQLADLVAGAVAHQRRADSSPNSNKGKVAARLTAAFGVESFGSDVRTERVNVQSHGARRVAPANSVVELQRRAR